MDSYPANLLTIGLPSVPTQRQLERKFRRAKLNVDAPGFYDSQRFIDAERAGQITLADYGAYVRVRTLEAASLAITRRRVPEVANYLAGELARDGRLGACIDISTVALKFLEHEGIWGYVAAGSAKVTFPPPGRTRVLHHLMHPNNPATAGHAWLVVPPFSVVDLSIQAQPRFEDAERAQLAAVVEEAATLVHDRTLDELAEDDLLNHFRRVVGRDGTLADFAGPELEAYWRESPHKQLLVGRVALKYLECGVMGSNDPVPLAQMRNLILSGNDPGALHADFLARFPMDGDGGN